MGMQQSAGAWGCLQPTPAEAGVDAPGKQPGELYLMERRGGCVISKTNLSTGWCSLSRITTTTFSTSFCGNKDRKTSLKRAVFCPRCASHDSHKVGVCLFVVAHSSSSYQSFSTARLFLLMRKKAFAKALLARC